MSEKENFPAVSAEWAMREFPNARNAERDMLLKLANLEPGMTVLDIQAAGGYLSDGIFSYLDGEVDLICLEPCKALNSRLSSKYCLIEDPVESWCSVPDQSVDVVMGLAGLHHSKNQLATVSEAYRVLKPGGRIVICDVIDGSDIACWLNDYVDRHNPAGHNGMFLKDKALSSLYRGAGFHVISEAKENVAWVFDTPKGAGRFFKGLFGLEPSEADVLNAMKQRLSLSQDNGRSVVDWVLIYGVAVK